MSEHAGVWKMARRFGNRESCQSGRGRPRSGINALPLSALRFALSPIGFQSQVSSLWPPPIRNPQSAIENASGSLPFLFWLSGLVAYWLTFPFAFFYGYFSCLPPLLEVNYD